MASLFLRHRPSPSNSVVKINRFSWHAPLLYAKNELILPQYPKIAAFFQKVGDFSRPRGEGDGYQKFQIRDWRGRPIFGTQFIASIFFAIWSTFWNHKSSFSSSVFPACWILIGQFKFQEHELYATLFERLGARSLIRSPLMLLIPFFNFFSVNFNQEYRLHPNLSQSNRLTMCSALDGRWSRLDGKNWPTKY